MTAAEMEKMFNEVTPVEALVQKIQKNFMFLQEEAERVT